MPTIAFVAVVVAVWVLTGLAAAVVLLGRQGYRGWRWYFLGAVLGLFFVPIAAERARRDTAVLEREAGAGSGTRRDREPATVVVGIDGSAESDRAVRLAAGLFADGARFVLVGVLDPDAAEFDDGRRAAMHDLLATRAAWLPADVAPPVVEIACGSPARVLLRLAGDEGADVLVLGRRGTGLSHRLLGSVAQAATAHSDVPVLLAGASRRRPLHRFDRERPGSGRPART
ncbi:universal stress protein [Pseudonocardia sp. RS010]|uniref:universal stress protein n=1 Tax=Pseudonocardia sp. RS010 TaxID=3385979 RepID=UPI0039A1AA09